MACPRGWYTERNGSTSALDGCTPCPLQTAGNATAAVSRAACVPCPDGAFALTLNSTACVSCPVGSFFTDLAAVATSCAACAAPFTPRCLGGVSCAAGYSSEARFCGACAAGEAPYYSVNDQCLPCADFWPLALLLGGGFAVGLLSVGLRRGEGAEWWFLRALATLRCIQSAGFVLATRAPWPAALLRLKDVIERATLSVWLPHPACYGLASWYGQLGGSVVIAALGLGFGGLLDCLVGARIARFEAKFIDVSCNDKR